MKKLGTYQSREVYWVQYTDFMTVKLPVSDWICMFTSTKSKPNSDEFDLITRKTILNGILEFKGHGKFGELLHDWFDETIAIMETMENHPEIGVMTTWHNNETLADVFWQCFFASCLPETTKCDNIKIICSDLDGVNRSTEISNYLVRFKNGWLPK